MAETTTLLFGRKGPQITGQTLGQVQFDAGLVEVPDYKNEVSRFPVENGTDKSDHIRLLPDELTLEGIITNTPIKVTFQDVTEQIEDNSNTRESTVNQRSGNPTFIEVAQNTLLSFVGRQIRGTRVIDPQVVDIITGLRVYPNMVVESLSFPRRAGDGQQLRVRMRLVQFETVNSEFVELPNPTTSVKDVAQSKIDKGKQTPTEPNENTSILAATVNKVFKGIGQ